MRKRKIAVAGMASLAMLVGTPAMNVLAAESSAVVQQQAETLTRGEFFSMLEQAVDLPEAKAQHTYKDVPRDSKLFKIVNKLQANGVLHGYGDGTVRPDSPLKASEAIALISGAIGIPNQPVEGTASPLPSSHWARNMAAWLASTKFVYNWDNPERTLNKQEAQALLKQLFSTSEEAKKLLEETQKAQQSIKSFRISGTISLGIGLKENAVAHMKAEEQQAFKALSNGMTMKMEGMFALPDAMYIKTGMNLPAALQGVGGSEMNVEEYVLGKDIYMKMPDNAPADPENSSGWVKMKNAFPMDIKTLMDQKMSGIPPQLEKKLFYHDAGNGELTFQGRIDKLTDLLSILNGAQGTEDVASSLQQAENVIQSIYMQGVMTIDSKTKLAKEAKAQVIVTFKDKVPGMEEMPIKYAVLNENISYSDYNSDLKIELPEAAKKAKEMPAIPAATPASKQ
jgi:hypothetical protein